MSEINSQFLDPLWLESSGLIAYATGIGILNVYPQATGYCRSYSGRAGQWREALSADQVKAIIAAHAPMMIRFGYLEPAC